MGARYGGLPLAFSRSKRERRQDQHQRAEGSSAKDEREVQLRRRFRQPLHRGGRKRRRQHDGFHELVSKRDARANGVLLRPVRDASLQALRKDTALLHYERSRRNQIRGFEWQGIEGAKKYMAEHPDEADHIECVEHGA